MTGQLQHVRGAPGFPCRAQTYGMGHRQVAAHLGLADGTVRGWIRRFRRRSEDVRQYFTVALAEAGAAAVLGDRQGGRASSECPTLRCTAATRSESGQPACRRRGAESLSTSERP